MQTVNADLPDIKRGDTLYANFIYCKNGEPVNLSGYTSALMQLRLNEYADAVLTLSSTGNTIDLSNLAAGQIIIKSPTDSVEAAQYYFDIQLKDDVNNIITTIRTGRVIFVEDYAR